MHTTEWIEGFLFVGNQPTLDLLNTRPVVDGVPRELLPAPQALERWLRAAGLVTEPGLLASLHGWSATEQAVEFLKELHGFRESLRQAVLAQQSAQLPSAEFLSALNALLQAYPPSARILVRDGRLVAEQMVPQAMPDHLWALVATQALALLTDPEPARIRKCESCAVQFKDVSKKGSRRWCSMNLCGNRVKVAAYQGRRKAAKAESTH